MSIVLVGGHERMQDEYREIGDKHGHRIKVFTHMPARFSKSIGLPDAIVLFTNTVSHKMVLTAVREAKKKKIPVMRCHTSSGNSLEEALKQLKLKL
ncbi:MAG: DUF2325 domain-containing protein [Bacillota bacterium]